jgi:hypothetical protein
VQSCRNVLNRGIVIKPNASRTVWIACTRRLANLQRQSVVTYRCRTDSRVATCHDSSFAGIDDYDCRHVYLNRQGVDLSEKAIHVIREISGWAQCDRTGIVNGGHAVSHCGVHCFRDSHGGNLIWLFEYKPWLSSHDHLRRVYLHHTAFGKSARIAAPRI